MASDRMKTAALSAVAAAALGLAGWAPPGPAPAPPADPPRAADAPAPPADPAKGAGSRIGETVDRTATTIIQGVRGTAETLREQFAKARTSVQAMGVQARVYSRLHWDKSLTGADLAPEVDRDGVATLRGSVASTEARAKAVLLARDTVGVTRVVDELKVRPRSEADTPAPAPAPGTGAPASPTRPPAGR